MPIYEYACTACQHEMEALQKISDSPLLTCPECGEDTLTKQISKVAFRLKGTGWYETDFKNKKKSEDKKDSAKSSNTDSKSDTKADGGTSKSTSESSDNKSSSNTKNTSTASSD